MEFAGKYQTQGEPENTAIVVGRRSFNLSSTWSTLGFHTTAKAAAFVGTMLDIKPILTIEHGLVESLDKLRGKKKLLDKLIAKIQDDSDFDAENPKFLIVQSDEDKGQEVCEKLRDEYGEDCIEMYGEFGPLIGTHVGRGEIAILVKIVTE